MATSKKTASDPTVAPQEKPPQDPPAVTPTPPDPAPPEEQPPETPPAEPPVVDQGEQQPPAPPEEPQDPVPPAPPEPPAPTPPEVPAEEQPDSDEVKRLKADQRQPAEKDPGPAPIDTPSLALAPVAPAEDLGEVRKAMPSDRKLSELDDADSARAAALRRQRDWQEDSKKFFKGPDRHEVERQENMVELNRLDAIERKRIADEKAERDRIAELEGREARLEELKAEDEKLRARHMEIVAEVERLHGLK